MIYQDDTFLADKYVNSHYFFAGYQIEMWREVACFISCENSKGKVFIFFPWISLPLTNEFEVHTVSWIYGPNTQAVGHKSEQEKQASIMYSMDQDSRLVRYLFYRWVQMEGGRF